VTTNTAVDWDNLNDDDLATALAVHAGQLLVSLRTDLISEGTSMWNLRDSGDMGAHHFLLDMISRVRPDDAVLSEEGADSKHRLSAERVWIIDPLDGTTEYGENRQDWAVHIALWSLDHFVSAAVSLPAVDKVFSTTPPSVLPPRTSAKPRLVTSRSRAPYSAIIVAQELDCDAFRLGSAGAKAMSVVMGDTDIYLHDGGMHQWDSAAPAAVAMAAGLHASRLDGSPLVYNKSDTWLPDFLICRQEFKEPVLDALWGDKWRDK